MTPLDRFYRIAEEGLCIGCGLCESLAGPDLIRMVVTPEGNERPIVEGDLPARLVDQIYDVCPGTRVEGLPERLIEADTRHDQVWGPWRRVVRAYAADPEIRFEGSTGGVMTALALFLLESGRVDFILHAKASTREPTFGERHLSFDRAAVLSAVGSRYGPTAPLIDIETVLDRGQPFGFMAKPCDVAALRNYARHDPRVDQLCKVTAVMVCGGFMPPPNMRAFLKDIGIDWRDVTALRYRGRGCPGPTTIETRDGRVVEKNYLDFWGEDESSWSLPFRCKICPDAIGEAADLAAADTWPGGSPSWEGQAGDLGTNAIIARTAVGEELLAAAAEAGYLTIERDEGPREMDLYQPHQVTKKQKAKARHLALAAIGRLAPATERLRIAELACEQGFRENMAQARGTRQRAREGRNDEPRPIRAEA